jgi:hypothetical protein
MPSPDVETTYRAEHDRLVNALKDHPGKKADLLLADVHRSFRTWNQRSVELRAMLQYGETDDEMQIELMQNIRPPVARDQYVSTLDSGLSAYLAAMGALIDDAGEPQLAYESKQPLPGDE